MQRGEPLVERVVVVGGGYVGLVTAACLADVGHAVLCVERDVERLACLRAGELPFHEPELEALVGAGLARGTLGFAPGLSQDTRAAGIVLVAVGSPSTAEGEIDDAQIVSAVSEVVAWTQRDVLVGVRSTASVGTHRRLTDLVASARHGIDVVMNPEFLRQGRAVVDFRAPFRMVLGGGSPGGQERLAALYRTVVGPEVPIVTMDAASAELTKLACNAMLALRVAFVNEVAALCDVVDGDIDAVRSAMILDPRIGPEHLSPSLGFGGSCLPKDARGLAQLGRARGVRQQLAEAALAANLASQVRWGERIEQVLHPLSDKRLAFWGLAFKAGTGDLRDSPAMAVLRRVRAAGAQVVAHDPLVSAEALAAEGVDTAATPMGAARGADAVVIGTAWTGYRDADLDALAQAMRGDAVFDGRNVVPRDAARAAGLRLVRVGAGATRVH